MGQDPAKRVTYIMKSILIAIISATFLWVATGFCQGQDKPPGSIKMLPGYTHQQLRGIDTQVGKFTCKDGPTIEYDIGELAGNYAEAQKDEATWFKKQVVNGQTVHLAFNKNKELTVTFTNGPANFFATIKSEEDMADVLLMVFTYTPPKSSR